MNENDLDSISREQLCSAPDMNALKEKLLLHANPCADRKQVKSYKSIDKLICPKPFSHRPHLTNDFMLADAKNERIDNTFLINEKETKIGALSCIPVASQEFTLVRDLLFCFVGIEGIYIKPKLKNNASSTNDCRKIFKCNSTMCT